MNVAYIDELVERIMERIDVVLYEELVAENEKVREDVIKDIAGAFQYMARGPF